MSEVEIITNKKGEQVARLKSNTAIDIPKPYTIVFKTTVQNEFETVHLTKKQYDGIISDIKKGQPGILLNGEYYDRFLISRIKKPN